MEASVFTYFVSIGAGVSFGLGLGAIPWVLVWRWAQRRGFVKDSKRREARA